MHFASTKTRLFIVSSGDGGASWDFEHEIYMQRDMREPFFIENQKGELVFSFFSAGTNPLAFQPHQLFRCVKGLDGGWGEPQVWGHDEEIVWQLVCAPPGLPWLPLC